MEISKRNPNLIARFKFTWRRGARAVEWNRSFLCLHKPRAREEGRKEEWEGERGRERIKVQGHSIIVNPFTADKM